MKTTMVNESGGMIVEVDSLIIPALRHNTSAGLTTKAGGETAVWNTSGKTPLIVFTMTGGFFGAPKPIRLGPIIKIDDSELETDSIVKTLEWGYKAVNVTPPIPDPGPGNPYNDTVVEWSLIATEELGCEIFYTVNDDGTLSVRVLLSFSNVSPELLAQIQTMLVDIFGFEPSSRFAARNTRRQRQQRWWM